MLRSTERILTTHVGSLVRPPEVMKIASSMLSRAEFTEFGDVTGVVFRDAIREIVHRQVELGIDIFSDGEFTKPSFSSYIRNRLGGVEHVSASHEDLMVSRRIGNLEPAQVVERRLFADFYRIWSQLERSMWLPPELVASSQAIEPIVACTAPLTYEGEDELVFELQVLADAVVAVGAEPANAFVSAVSPSLVEWRILNEYYPSHEEYLFAAADALNIEYSKIINAGFMLQIDAPDLTFVYSPDDIAGYLRWLDLRIEAVNHSLAGLPLESVRFHLCWGSWNTPHVTDVPLKLIIERVLKINAGAFSFEGANARHEHEFGVWEETKIPEDRILIPGVVGHASNVVEHPELVAWRIANYAKIVGRENVIAGTDCGFSQGWNVPRVHPSIQWAKLRALVEGAELASKTLWT